MSRNENDDTMRDALRKNLDSIQVGEVRDVEITQVEDTLVAQAPLAETADLMAVATAVRADNTDENADAKPSKSRWRGSAVVAIPVILGLGVMSVAFIGNADAKRSNATAEKDVTAYLEDQGATVSAVECTSRTECTAIIDGSAYSVVVLKDSDGKKQYGVSNYAG